jgi:hypothetical protein
MGASIASKSIKERGRSGMDGERLPAEDWKARKQHGGGVSYDDLVAYLPSRFDDAKMAKVTYIDPKQYVIVHWAKWQDPSGARYWVEYRDTRYAHHDEDAYDRVSLQKWQNGVLVETLSRAEFRARMKKWTYDPEPAIPDAVWWQLELVTYDVKMQWTVQERNGVHLMEIRRYRLQTSQDLYRDGKRLYAGYLQMLQEEQTKMKEWLGR